MSQEPSSISNKEIIDKIENISKLDNNKYLHLLRADLNSKDDFSSDLNQISSQLNKFSKILSFNRLDPKIVISLILAHKKRENKYISYDEFESIMKPFIQNYTVTSSHMAMGLKVLKHIFSYSSDGFFNL